MFSMISFVAAIACTLTFVLELIKAIQFHRLLPDKRYAQITMGEIDNSFKAIRVMYTYEYKSGYIKLNFVTKETEQNHCSVSWNNTESGIVIGSFSLFANEKCHVAKFAQCSKLLEQSSNSTY